MRRITLALACLCAMSMAACSTVGQLAAGPVAVANQTKLDEQVGLTVTLAYTAAARAAGLAIEVAAATGHPFPPATVQRIGQLDQRAFAAVKAIRAAYLAGNSASYLSAVTQARAAIGDLLAAAKGT